MLVVQAEETWLARLTLWANHVDNIHPWSTLAMRSESNHPTAAAQEQ